MTSLKIIISTCSAIIRYKPLHREKCTKIANHTISMIRISESFHSSKLRKFTQLPNHNESWTQLTVLNVHGNAQNIIKSSNQFIHSSNFSTIQNIIIYTPYYPIIPFLHGLVNDSR